MIASTASDPRIEYTPGAVNYFENLDFIINQKSDIVGVSTPGGPWTDE
jgi:hypothetical protein